MRRPSFCIMQPSAIKVFSARARESALRVRRHQSALGASAQTPGTITPAIAARVKELLAEKAKKAAPKGGKGKAKAKGKGPAKKKDARTPQEKKNQNRADVAKQTGMGDLEGAIVRLNAGAGAAGQEDLEKDAHDKLVGSGLAQRHADGSISLSPAGKRWKAAADRGDAEGARTALSDAKSGQADRAAKEKTANDKKADRVSKQAAKQTEVTKKKAAAITKQKQRARGSKKPSAVAAKPVPQASSKPAAQPAITRSQAPAGGSVSAASGSKSSAAPNADSAVTRAKNVTQIADDTGLGDHLANLDKFKGGKDLNEKDAAELEKRGLVERADDGTPRMSAAGNALIAAAARGDKRAALDAVSRGQDAAKKKTAGKAMTDLAIKAGARHSKTDLQHLQGIHDSAVACGANCGMPGDDPADEDTDAEASKAIKGIMDDPGYYAQHECGDIMQASSGLQTLAMLIQSELSEDDEDDGQVQKLCDAADTLIAFLQGELDELRGAAKDDAATIEHEPMKAVSDATPLRALAGLDVTPLTAHIMGGAIKALDEDAITGCAVLYGTKAAHDIERDYYDKNTDLWLNDFGFPRPITYHHGMDEGTRDDPIVGHWTKAVQTDEGVWLEGQLDRAHKYYKAIKELAARGYLKMSSDSAPQWVQREKQSNGANYIKRWPLVTSSVTVTPMEPRMMPVEIKAYLAELGYANTDSQEAINTEHARHDGAKAGDERARALLLELDLLELETA